MLQVIKPVNSTTNYNDINFILSHHTNQPAEKSFYR